MSVQELDRPTGEMNVLDTSGHTKVTWNRNVPAEVEIAKAAYESSVAKGGQAFTIRSDGNQGRRLDSFDPNAEQIMMVPRLQGG